MPEGVSYRGSKYAPASAIVEQVVTRVQGVNQGYGAVIDGDSKYKIYSLVAGDVVKRIIFKKISIDTASCEIQDGNTTIKGTVRNVNNVHVNVIDANNTGIKQLKTGELPENANEFSTSYKNMDNTRRYYVKGIGDNNIESSYSLNPVQNCKVLADTRPDLTQFDGLFTKKTIKGQIKRRKSNKLEDLIDADTAETKSDILSEYGIMEYETKQKLLREESYYNLFISCLADYIRRNNL